MAWGAEMRYKCFVRPSSHLQLIFCKAGFVLVFSSYCNGLPCDLAW